MCGAATFKSGTHKTNRSRKNCIFWSKFTFSYIYSYPLDGYDFKMVVHQFL